MAHTFNSCIAALVLAALPSMAALASELPAGYAYTAPLTVSGKNAVLQVRLPQGVYLHARSAALDDLRIFDATGKSQPYALVRPAAQAQSSRRQFPVKLFPVGMAPGAQRDSRNDVDVRTSADGSSVSVTTRHQPGMEAPRGAIMLDLGARERVDALVFTPPSGGGNYQGQVLLEVSDDLQQWETVGYASLNWLANSYRDTLSSNRMEFDARTFRYGRLAWRSGEPVQFAAVVAESEEGTLAAPAMDSVTLAPRAGSVAGDLVYDAAIAIPVRRMALVFSEANVVMPAQLGQYVMRASGKGAASMEEVFAPRLQSTFFKISQDGKTRSAGELDLAVVHAQSWVVRPQTPSGVQPRMKLSWTPAALVFMAGGTAPYTLHVGSPGAQPGQRSLSQVAPGFSDEELAGLEQAQVGALEPNRVKPVEADQNGGDGRWRIAALWAVLLAGVAVLGWMAWRLLGQMKGEGEK